MTDLATHVSSLLSLDLDLGGATCTARLRIPSVEEVLPAVVDPASSLTPERYRNALRLELLAIVDAVDGHEATLAEIDAMLDAPAALRAVLQARNDVYGALLQAGRFSCPCPHCGAAALQDLATYAILGLGAAELPAVVTPTLPATPHLADPAPPRTRSDVPPCGPISFELPSAKAGLDTAYTGGILADVGVPSETVAAAWDLWAPSGGEQPLGRKYRQRGNRGFAAILHACLALRRLDGAERIDPDTLEQMLVPDFYFIDSVYYLTHDEEVPPDSGLRAPCPACGRVYVRAR
jgi:hypothetical protein